MAQPPLDSRSISPSSDVSSTSLSRPRKNTIHLTPDRGRNDSQIWRDQDPRSSSMHSLRPIESAQNRRTLLIIYIHGFMGSETSFKSFPAHVHTLITSYVNDTHVVHTKIYPKYKSRRDISYARDDFSNWLVPHESPTTDVILVGHSIGGILAAEVALLPSHTPGSEDLHQHRILGVCAFDTPFLGIHPSVVGTGIISLFRSPEASPFGAPNAPPSMSAASGPFSMPVNDPYYDPAYANDVKQPQRTRMESLWHFWNKHAGEMTKATKTYFTSYLEFGGCLADYPGLKRRYDDIRGLEDVDQFRGPDGKLVRRVRFVNYYTASSGVVKVRADVETVDKALLRGMQDAVLEDPEMKAIPEMEHKDLEMQTLEAHPLTEDENEPDDLESLTVRMPKEFQNDHDPRPADQVGHDNGPDGVGQGLERTTKVSPLADTPSPVEDRYGHEDLPPIPPNPSRPPDLDESQYTAKDALKLAQKDYQRQIKLYERMVKDREKTIRDREKMIKKRQQEVLKKREKEAKLQQKQKETAERERLKQDQMRERDRAKQIATLNPNIEDEPVKKKDRKFCSLPEKDPRTGLRDNTWVRVYMEGMDEVVAHTSLFDISETYTKLVGDTAERFDKWVRENKT